MESARAEPRRAQAHGARVRQRPQVRAGDLRQRVRARAAAVPAFVLVIDTDEVNGWVIAWPPGSDTGFHDHDGSRVVIVGLRGEVAEQRPLFGSSRPESQVCQPRDVIELSPAAIHRMHNVDGRDTALTLYLYSPPLVRQGVYPMQEGKSMLRVAVDGGEELHPLTGREELP